MSTGQPLDTSRATLRAGDMVDGPTLRTHGCAHLTRGAPPVDGRAAVESLLVFVLSAHEVSPPSEWEEPIASGDVGIGHGWDVPVCRAGRSRYAGDTEPPDLFGP